MNNLLLPGKSTSSIFQFLQIFFDLPDLLTVLSSRELHNNAITFFADAMTEFNVIRRNTATYFVKNIQHLLLQYFSTNFTRMLKMSRHSLVEYCAFAQYCRSKVTNLIDNRILTLFVIDTSELSLVIVSDKLRTSSITLLLASFLASCSLLCRDETVGIVSV